MNITINQSQDNTIHISFDAYNYTIDEINFADILHNQMVGIPEYWQNWPILYILRQKQSATAATSRRTNKKLKAYIGQTTDGRRRMEQHNKSKKKLDLEEINFIYSSEFNQSVTFDYESKLIRLFAADGKYTLINGNDGLADKNYYNKKYYDNGFEVLWEGLRQHKIVAHTIEEITNSDVFKYSPYKSLNDEQLEAAAAILEAISADVHQPIVIKGMPGSGKTIVAIYMFKFLRDKFLERQKEDGTSPPNMALVIPQASLRKTLKKLFAGIYRLKAADVIGPSEVVKNKYDIVFVDEAHRLRQRKNIVNFASHDANNSKLHLPEDATELDWILESVDKPILLFDADQVIGPSGIGETEFNLKISGPEKRKPQTFTLKSQMRVAGGVGYLEYIKSILQLNNRDFEKRLPQNYEFKIVEDFGVFHDLMHEKEKVYGLSRMLAGYAWPWKSKNDSSKMDISIDEHEYQWNATTTDWVNSSNSVNEVGSIHCIQGYDLNYGFVILGPDIKYDVATQSIYADKNNYFDSNGKRNATAEELTRYIKNIYYVLMSRGIKGTYLYVCDEPLKEYLKQYIEVL